jgi:hypothetical protein
LLLPARLKKAATEAFRDNKRLSGMSSGERELAAQFYELVAVQTVGDEADLARLYNQERARFLRGDVDRIAATAHRCAREKGMED